MQSFPFSECLSFCMNKDDSRWNEMCSHPLNPSGSTCQDKLLGMEECKSPFGIYELKIPVNKDLACENTGITDKNCKDLDVRNPITRSFEFANFRFPSFSFLLKISTNVSISFLDSFAYSSSDILLIYHSIVSSIKNNTFQTP